MLRALRPPGNLAPRQREPELNVTFYGVRGSCPCSDDSTRRYGGNTACIAIESDGDDLLILDLGTGLRPLGLRLPTDGSLRASALVSHLHWDHVQGLPFFTPVDRPGALLDVYGPGGTGHSLEDAFDQLVRPPYFPVRLGELRGKICFHDVLHDDLSIGAARIKARPVPHVGTTVGYRVELDGRSLAYLSDHQQPVDGAGVAESVLELCDGVDLLIHDAQYTRREFDERPHWGHCTVDFAVRVASEAGARKLALFHHDPSHADAEIDDMLAEAERAGRASGVDDVIAAAEGLTVRLGRH